MSGAVVVLVRFPSGGPLDAVLRGRDGLTFRQREPCGTPYRLVTHIHGGHAHSAHSRRGVRAGASVTSLSTGSRPASPIGRVRTRATGEAP